MIAKTAPLYDCLTEEAEQFDFFKDRVLSDLTSNNPDKDLRIWSAACSTGEEPYMLAMIIDQFLGPQKASWDTKILASDVSNKVLDVAKKGIYDLERIAPLPSVWKTNYFKKVTESYAILHEEIKNEVIFRKFNLNDTVFPFKKKFHVIFCRNVISHFDYATREELTDKFYHITEDGGYLFIGHCESLNHNKTQYKCLMPSVYRKME